MNLCADPGGSCCRLITLYDRIVVVLRSGTRVTRAVSKGLRSVNLGEQEPHLSIYAKNLASREPGAPLEPHTVSECVLGTEK